MQPGNGVSGGHGHANRRMLPAGTALPPGVPLARLLDRLAPSAQTAALTAGLSRRVTVPDVQATKAVPTVQSPSGPPVIRDSRPPPSFLE